MVLFFCCVFCFLGFTSFFSQADLVPFFSSLCLWLLSNLTWKDVVGFGRCVCAIVCVCVCFREDWGAYTMVCLCVYLEIAQKEERWEEDFFNKSVFVHASLSLSVHLTACDLVLSFYWKCVCLSLCWNVFPLVPRHVCNPRGGRWRFLSAGKCAWEMHNAVTTSSPPPATSAGKCVRVSLCVCVSQLWPNGP